MSHWHSATAHKSYLCLEEGKPLYRLELVTKFFCKVLYLTDLLQEKIHVAVDYNILKWGCFMPFSAGYTVIDLILNYMPQYIKSSSFH